MAQDYNLVHVVPPHKILAMIVCYHQYVFNNSCSETTPSQMLPPICVQEHLLSNNIESDIRR
jgi:hypothetical protein